jgi:hypothetical protein
LATLLLKWSAVALLSFPEQIPPRIRFSLAIIRHEANRFFLDLPGVFVTLGLHLFDPLLPNRFTRDLNPSV